MKEKHWNFVFTKEKFVPYFKIKMFVLNINKNLDVFLAKKIHRATVLFLKFVAKYLTEWHFSSGKKTSK